MRVKEAFLEVEKECHRLTATVGQSKSCFFYYLFIAWCSALLFFCAGRACQFVRMYWARSPAVSSVRNRWKVVKSYACVANFGLFVAFFASTFTVQGLYLSLEDPLLLATAFICNSLLLADADGSSLNMSMNTFISTGIFLLGSFRFSLSTVHLFQVRQPSLISSACLGSAVLLSALLALWPRTSFSRKLQEAIFETSTPSTLTHLFHRSNQEVVFMTNFHLWGLPTLYLNPEKQHAWFHYFNFSKSGEFRHECLDRRPTVAGLLRRRWPHLLLAVINTSFWGAYSAITPFVLQDLFGDYQLYPYLMTKVYYTIFHFPFSTFVSSIDRVSLLNFETRITAIMYCTVLDRLLSMKSAAMASRVGILVKQDLMVVSYEVLGLLLALIPTIISLVGSIIFISSFSAETLAVIAGCMTIDIFVRSYCTKKVLDWTEMNRVKYSRRMLLLRGMVEGIDIVRSLSVEERLCQTINEVAIEEIHCQRQIQFYGAVMGIESSLLETIPQAAMILFPVYLEGKTLGTDVIVSILVITGAITALRSLSHFAAISIGMLESFNAVRSFLRAKVQDTEAVFQNPGDTTTSALALFKDPVFFVSSTFLLRAPSMSLTPGVHSLCYGDNGSGKSSFCMCLLGELELLSGEFRRTTSVAFLSQNPWIFAGTLRQNILFDPKRISDAEFMAILESSALTDDVAGFPGNDNYWLEHHGWNISGGQKQRIGIARCLAKQDSLLCVLDEPFSSLDRISLLTCSSSLTSLKKRSVLITTGTKSVPSSWFRSLLTIRAGTVVEASDSLFQEPEKEENSSAAGNASRQADEKQIFSALLVKFCVESDSSASHSQIYFSSLDSSWTFGKVPMTRVEDTLAHYVKWVTEIRIPKSPFPYHLSLNREKSNDDIDDRIMNLPTDVKSGRCNYHAGRFNQNTEAESDFSLLQNVQSDGLLRFFGLKFILIWIFTTIHRSTFSMTTLVLLTSVVNRTAIDPVNTMITFYVLSFCGLILAFAVSLLEWRTAAVIMEQYHRKFIQSIVSRRPTIVSALSEQIYERLGSDFVDLGALFSTVGGFSGSVAGMLSIPLPFLSTDPFATLPIFIAAIVVGLFSIWFQRKVNAVSHFSMEAIAQLPSYSSSLFRDSVSIRAFNAKALFLEIGLKKALKFLKVSIIMFSMESINSVLFGHYVNYIMEWLYFLSVIYSSTPLASLSFYALFKTYGAGLLFWIPGFVGVYSGLYKLRLRVLRCQELLHAGILDDQCEMALEKSRSGLLVTNLYVSYYSVCGDPTPALRGVSLKVAPGAVVGIFGKSGSGKSTLLNTLLGFLPVDSGNVDLDNVSITSVSMSQWSRMVAFAPQKPQFFHGSIKEELDPRNEHSESVIRSALRRCAILNVILGLEGRLDASVDKVHSAGHLQQLSNARLFLKSSSANMAIFDEPTSQLGDFEDRMFGHFVNSFDSIPTLIVSHRQTTLRSVSYVYRLHSGCMVLEGTSTDISYPSNPNHTLAHHEEAK